MGINSTLFQNEAIIFIRILDKYIFQQFFRINEKSSF